MRPLPFLKLITLLAVLTACTSPSTPPPTPTPPTTTLLEVAAGKPTTASGYWSASEQHAYPPQNVVDRQVEELEGCQAGPTTYWLLPDHQSGWVQIDLQQTFRIVRVRWLNTHNGRCGNDRATIRFHIAVSQNDTFSGEEQIVYTGSMEFSGTPEYQESNLPEPIPARFVRFYVDEYTNWGGGLNELEVYAQVILPD